jgi:hypothetical protein
VAKGGSNGRWTSSLIEIVVFDKIPSSLESIGVSMVETEIYLGVVQRPIIAIVGDDIGVHPPAGGLPFYHSQFPDCSPDEHRGRKDVDAVLGSMLGEVAQTLIEMRVPSFMCHKLPKCFSRALTGKLRAVSDNSTECAEELGLAVPHRGFDTINRSMIKIRIDNDSGGTLRPCAVRFRFVSEAFKQPVLQCFQLAMRNEGSDSV